MAGLFRHRPGEHARRFRHAKRGSLTSRAPRLAGLRTNGSYTWLSGREIASLFDFGLWTLDLGLRRGMELETHSSADRHVGNVSSKLKSDSRTLHQGSI